MKKTAEVLIIGAGTSGAALAYYLTQKGLKDVLLLEKSGVGSGATGQAAGLIRHHYPEREIVRMAKYSAQKLHDFQDETGRSIDYVNNGFCYLTPPGAAGIEEVVAMQQAEGVDQRLLSPEELRELYPLGPLNPEGAGYALYDPRGAYADPYKLAAAYCELAREAGARLEIGQTVRQLVVEGTRVSHVRTDQEEYEAAWIVNAAGLGADALNRGVGIALPLYNFSLGHVLALPDQPFAAELPTLTDASVDSLLYFVRPETAGTVLIGMDQDDPAREFNPETYYMDVPFDRMGRLYAHISKRLPFTAGFRITTQFGALDVRTPDWNPGLGVWQDGPRNLYQLVGGSGHCFKLAPAMGLLAAEEILGEPLSYTMDCFAVNRLRGMAEQERSFLVDQ